MKTNKTKTLAISLLVLSTSASAVTFDMPRDVISILKEAGMSSYYAEYSTYKKGRLPASMTCSVLFMDSVKTSKVVQVEASTETGSIDVRFKKEGSCVFNESALTRVYEDITAKAVDRIAYQAKQDADRERLQKHDEVVARNEQEAKDRREKSQYRYQMNEYASAIAMNDYCQAIGFDKTTFSKFTTTMKTEAKAKLGEQYDANYMKKSYNKAYALFDEGLMFTECTKQKARIKLTENNQQF
ncbi:hypothetical protein [Photobacterium carnosum]|uniref:hypothetical protein n=1 Tax=Photobacterium carnosum TaxID=2023717 RepID=UPI001E2DC819|nr:hypothetical protein [Photobacterium carnosum]MCD9498860.1 hypothetical protein [Photobacterium carnosum]